MHIRNYLLAITLFITYSFAYAMPLIFFDEYQDVGNDWHLLRNNKTSMLYALTGSGLTLGRITLGDTTVFEISKLPLKEQAKWKSEYCMFWSKGAGIWDKTWANFLKTHTLGQRLTSTNAASKELTCNTYNNAKSNCATAGEIDRCIDIKMGWDNDKPLISSVRSYVKNMCK
jgi:hypothetical protein